MTVRGDTTVIVDEHRPVPLWQHVLVGNRLYDLFVDATSGTTEGQPGRCAGSPATTAAHEVNRRPPQRPPARRRRPRRLRPPRRADVIERLDRAGLLPAITFIFSRAGCDAAVEQCLHAGLRLTAAPRRPTRSARIVEERTARHPGRGPRRPRLPRVARRRSSAASRPTTPGMLPTFKEIVEELFVRGPGQGGLRHRDAGAGHQHAGPHGGARAAGQVERRGARRPDAGGVHPADRAGRPARHRRRGPRGRAVDARRRPAARSPGLAVDPHLSAALELPAVVQHGRQPGRPGRPRARPRRCWSRRSRSSRPTGRSSGWPGRCGATRRRWRATARR